ncbi:MAG TPA: hypothetical protein VEH08_01990 [Methanomassiliicoccales archaeon]|nr:hypothetical protein [Methanomassiliicoccales archaeon]
MSERIRASLGLYFRVIVVLAVFTIIITLPFTLRRGLVGALSTSFNIALAFLAVHGTIVLWRGKDNFKTWYRPLLKWSVIVAAVLAAALTIIYVATGVPLNLAGFELRSVERLMNVYSGEGGTFLFVMVWALLMGLTWFFVAALAGGTWMVVQVERNGIPALVVELKKQTFGKGDPWARRTAAWLLSFPRVLNPSAIRLDVEPAEVRHSRGRILNAVAWQVAIGSVIGMYVSLNPTLLAIVPFAETYALVSIPVGLMPLLTLPLLTLEAIGAKVPGPGSDYYVYRGGKTRALQLLLALGGLFWIVWWAASNVGLERIVLMFAVYVVLLTIFSIMASFVYIRFFEDGLVSEIVARLKPDGID